MVATKYLKRIDPVIGPINSSVKIFKYISCLKRLFGKLVHPDFISDIPTFTNTVYKYSKTSLNRIGRDRRKVFGLTDIRFNRYSMAPSANANF